jgi:hypothetical protein
MILIILYFFVSINRRSGPASSTNAARNYLGTRRGSISGGTNDEGSVGSPLDDSANDDSPA